MCSGHTGLRRCNPNNSVNVKIFMAPTVYLFWGSYWTLWKKHSETFSDKIFTDMMHQCNYAEQKQPLFVWKMVAMSLYVMSLLSVWKGVQLYHKRIFGMLLFFLIVYMERTHANFQFSQHFTCSPAEAVDAKRACYQSMASECRGEEWNSARIKSASLSN